MAEAGSTDFPRPGEIASVDELIDLLQRRRATMGLTIRDLAAKSGVPRSTINGYLKGKHLPFATHPKPFLDLLGALGIDTSDPLPWQRLLARLAWSREPKSLASLRPYQGLESFDAKDAALFFGRERETAELVAMITQTENGGPDHRLIAVVGPSGSGKSSLVKAGLVPRLGDWEVEIVRPGPAPVSALGAAVAALNERAANHRLVVVDQVEQLWTQASPADRERAVELMGQVLASGVTIVATLRSDFYTAALESPFFARALRLRQVALGPMTEEELAQTITGPAEYFGFSIASGLVERIIGDVGFEAAGPGHAAVLPNLSYCLAAMWRLREAMTLTHQQYEAVGKLHGAVAQSSEEIYTSLNQAQQSAARSLLLRLVVLEPDLPPTAGVLALDDLADADTIVVAERLTNERLLANDGSRITMAHDALVLAWPRLTQWIDEDRDLLVHARTVHREAMAWESANREPGLLLRGSRLSSAEDVMTRRPGWLRDIDRELLLESQADRDRRRVRRTRQLRRARGAVAVILVLALATLGAWRSAVGQRDLALHREALAVSRGVLDRDPLLALAIGAVSAASQDDNDDSPGVMVDAYRRLGGQGGQRVGPVMEAGSKGVTGIDISADGRRLAASYSDGRVRLWDPTTGSLAHTLQGPAGSVAATALDISPDGSSLAAAYSNGEARVWSLAEVNQAPVIVELGQGRLRGVHFATDSATAVAYGYDGSAWLLRLRPDGTHTQTMRLDHGQAIVWDAAFSPDGSLLATAGSDGSVRLWRVADGGLEWRSDPALASGLAPAPVTAVTFAPDGRSVFTAMADFTIRQWRVDDHQAVGKPMVGHEGRIRKLLVSPDGRVLASASEDTTLRLWNVTTHLSVRKLVEHTGTVNDLDFNAAGSYLVSGSADGTGMVWDLADPDGSGLPLLAHQRSVSATRFLPNGTTLVTGSDDGTLRRWDISAPAPLSQQFLSGNDAAIAVDRTGTYLAVAQGKQVSVFDASSRRLLRVLNSQTGQIRECVFSADGALLAVASYDGFLHVWNWRESSAPIFTNTPRDHGEKLVAVALSPDGATLVGAGESEQLWRWNLATHPQLGEPIALPPAIPTDRIASTGDSTTVKRKGTWALAYNPAGTLLVVGAPGGDLIGYDPASWTQAWVAEGHTDLVRDLAFSPDGQRLVSGGDDQRVGFWDQEGHAIVPPVGLHSQKVYAVAFDSDGKRVASASDRGEVQLWNPATGEPIGSPLADYTTGWIRSMAFLPDGDLGLSTHKAGTRILASTIDPPSACRLILPLLSRAELATSAVGGTLAERCADIADR